MCGRCPLRAANSAGAGVRRFWLAFRARWDEGITAVFTVGEFVTVEVEEPEVDRLAACKAFLSGDAPGVRTRGVGSIHSAQNTQ